MKQPKSKSTAKGVGKIDFDANIYLQKTVSTQSREEPKRINSICIASKNTPSKELYKENKENTMIDREPFGVTTNSEYIKSLYRKYLGKENEAEKGDRTMRPTESLAALKDSTSLLGNNSINKLSSHRESGKKIRQAVNSTSKKELVNTERNKRSEEEGLELMEMCDMENSCIKAMVALRQARKRNSSMMGF